MSDTDFSELTDLTRDLGEAPRNVGPFLRSALMKTAGNIKKDAAASVGNSEMWSGAAGAINYDVEATAGDSASTLVVEVGYDKQKAGGALGNLREFGAPAATYGGKVVPLAPHNDLRDALRGNADDFERGIDRAVEDALKKAGL